MWHLKQEIQYYTDAENISCVDECAYLYKYNCLINIIDTSMHNYTQDIYTTDADDWWPR